MSVDEAGFSTEIAADGGKDRIELLMPTESSVEVRGSAETGGVDGSMLLGMGIGAAVEVVTTGAGSLGHLSTGEETGAGAGCIGALMSTEPEPGYGTKGKGGDGTANTGAEYG